MSTANRSELGLSTVLLLALLLGGCGGKDNQTNTADQTASAAAEADPETSPPDQPTEAAENSAEAPLTPEDIDRWEKGLEGELNAVRQGREKLKSARNQKDSVNTMMEVQLAADSGAKAAGLEPQRYKFIHSKLSDLASSLSSWTHSETTSDTTGVAGAVRDEMRQTQEDAIQSASAEVPPEVVEAMKPRANELNKKFKEVASEHLKVFGLD